MASPPYVRQKLVHKVELPFSRDLRRPGNAVHSVAVNVGTLFNLEKPLLHAPLRRHVLVVAALNEVTFLP